MAAISPIMSIMIKAAEKAARSLNRDFGEVEQLQVSRKGPADFVTAADKRAEAIIHEELKKARPGFSFLMEEGGEIKGTDGENRWIIDPLDGTHNFMHGIPHFSISIALETRGEIMAGLVYDPVKDEMFRAERGTGAFMRNKRLRVSNRDRLEMCSIATGNPGMDNKAFRERFFRELVAVTAVSPMIRRMASAALDLAYVGAGRLDGYFERDVKPWDVAAGYLIVRESGGFCTSIDTEENPVFSGQIIAGNQSVHQNVRKLVRAAA